LYLSIIRIKNALSTKDCTVIQSAEISFKFLQENIVKISSL